MKTVKIISWTSQWLLFACCCLIDVTSSCGVVTHIEISHQALANYDDIKNDVDYSHIASSQQAAFEAGSAYPDAFYPPTCFFGQYHDVSEDTHWTQFLNASILYINTHYPKPWNTDVKRLVAFLLGVVSHQVADVLWHSLGIEQGFIQTMAKMNFHDVYPNAHTVADTGGDVLNVYQLNMDYSSIFGDWYVPVNHLTKIYQEMYGNEHVNSVVVRACSEMLFLYKIAARAAAGTFYESFAQKSPFLVDHLYSYFQGGITDMAAWTRRIWKEYTTALESNLQNCLLPKSSLFIRCNATYQLLKNLNSRKDFSLKNGFYSDMNTAGLSVKDIDVEETEGGVFLRASQRIQNQVGSWSQSKDDNLYYESERDMKLRTMRANQDLDSSSTLPNHVYTTGVSYAQLGSAYAVGDLNGDGFDDLAVGSAGVYPGGVVYLLFGSGQGMPTDHENIEQVADMIIPMPVDDYSESSLFGASLATFDLDLDGQLELVVGAPSYKAVDLLYQGRVFILSLNASNEGNVSTRTTIDCDEQFCNLGYSLHADNTTECLVIGAPFAGAGGAQRGAIAILTSNNQFAGQVNMQFHVHISGRNVKNGADEIALYTILGEMDYGWRGYSLESAITDNSFNLIFGDPGIRDCANPSCDYNPSDNQTVGDVVCGVMDDGQFSPVATVSQGIQFQQLGMRLAFGQPLRSGPIVLAASGPSSGVAGKVLFTDFTLDQAGTVYLLQNITEVTAFVSGDRSYGHFGELVKFSDLTNDGLDELIIGAPLWTKFLMTGVQEGRVYVYGGGQYPKESDISGSCKDYSFINLCPEKNAYKVLSFGESGARFGSQAISLKSRDKTSLFVTAAHSSKSGRLAGAIGVFDFSH